jgi:hypothetical protein
MIGNTVAVLAIAKWEGAFDADRFRAYVKTQNDMKEIDAPREPSSAPLVARQSSSK